MNHNFGANNCLPVDVHDVRAPLLPHRHGESPGAKPPTIKAFAVLLSFLFLLGLLFVAIDVYPAEMPEFRLTSASLSSPGFSPSSPRVVFADWNITFSIRNSKSGADMVFDAIDAWLYRGQDFLSKTAVKAPFSRVRDEERVLEVGFAAIPTVTYVDSTWKRYEPGERETVRTEASTAFDALIQARVRFNPRWWSWLQRKALLLVDCNDVVIAVSPDATTGRLAVEEDYGSSCNVTLHQSLMLPL